MFLPENTTAFTTDQLGQLDAAVSAKYPGLTSWARELNMAKPPVIQNLALIATWSLLQTSRMHEADFRAAVTAGHAITEQRKNLGYKSPIDCAGRAAGLAVKASLYIAWYDLNPGDFVAAPIDMFRAMGDSRSEPLDRAVGSLPKEHGLVDFTGHSLYIKNMFAAEEVIRTSGPAALNQFVQNRPPVGP